MKIKKLILKNGYKRFHHLTIDLGANPARIIALVGPNGSGKSSVLDGLMFHQNAHHKIGSSNNADSAYHSMNPSNLVTYQDVEIEFTEGNFSAMRDKRQKQGKPNTIFSLRSPYRYNNHIKITEIRATTPISENNYGATFASALDSKMEDNYRRLQAAVNQYMEEYDVKPTEARSKIIGDLNASIKNCLEIEISSVGNVEAGRGTLYFKKADHPYEFEFNVLSSGEKEVVDLLLDLYLRRSDYDDSVFLIDEPELHVNTSIQRNLLLEIDKLVGANCQIWLTTHSIGFLRALQAQMADKCQIIQFDSNLKLSSTAQILEPMKKTAAAWRELFAVALDDLATLVSPKTIIYCEGRDQPGGGGVERGMDAKVFNNIFAESHPDSVFISSGGNTELDQRSTIAISILSKVFKDVEILVFKDRDMASGKMVDENDRQVYLKNNPQNHRVMKRFEIENYLYDRDVLRKYCSANNLFFNESDYNSFVKDVVNQNLKDSTSRIKNICGIKGSINSDVFKVSLSEHFTEDMPVFMELRECIFERK